MQKFNIKSFNLQSADKQPHQFFILSKGQNASKPLETPCPNCFCVAVNVEAERLSLYWLCYALWQAGCFRQYLCGSVIDFLHIGDVRKLLNEHALRIKNNPDLHNKYLSLLQNLLVYEHKLKEQLQKIQQLKSSLPAAYRKQQ